MILLIWSLFIVQIYANTPEIEQQEQEQDVPIHTNPHLNQTSLSIFFVFLSLGFGSFLKEINKSLKIPYSPMLFVIGLLSGYYWDSLGVIGLSCKTISEIEPVGVLVIFLPTLIYESGYNFEWHLFKRLFGQTFILAFPCVVVLTTSLQLCVKLVLNYQDDYYSWESAFMFGAMLSCTDTVAVLALLKESGAGKRFQALIEGESLLNDGACMVLFQISYGIVKGKSASSSDIGSLFLSLCLGGTILGLLFGMVCVYWIKKISNDEILVLNITIVSSFLVFFVAENVHLGVHISGVLGLVSLSLFMAAFGRSRISHEADHALREFWEYIVYASETIIFLLGGIIAGIRVFKEDSQITELDFYKMLALWGCLMGCRFFSIIVFYPLLRKYGYGLTLKEVLVLTYGGLRGSIGIAFALIVAKDEDLPPKWRDIILFHMSGIAVCTLVVNGTTLALLIKMLGLSTQSDIREKIYAGFLQKLTEEIESECKKSENLKYLKQAQWDMVKEYSGIKIIRKQCEKIQEKLAKKEKKEIQMQNIQTPLNPNESIDDEQELDQDMLIEIRRIFQMALKGVYREIFEQNQCTPDTIILLIESANLDLDNDKEPMNSWEFLQSQFSEREINILFYFKDTLLIGRFAKAQLFSYIYFIYDIVSTYIQALKILKEEASHYNFPQNLLLEIINEVDDNKKSAVEYLQGYLEVSFPEISKELHTKKAAFEILEFEKSVLKNNLLSGQLSEKDFLIMKRNIDKKVRILNDLSPNWQMPTLFEALSGYELFKSLTEQQIRKLMEVSKQESFGRDQFIYREGERANFIAIINRGAGSEYSDKYKIREKRLLNDSTPIYMIVAPSMKYQTSLVAECVINVTLIKLQQVKELLQQVPEFEEQVWLSSIHLLSRIYFDKMKPVGYLKKAQIQEMLKVSVFVKARKNTLVRIDHGCILFKGTLVENKGSIQESLSEDDDSQQPVTSSNDNDSWRRDGICYIPGTTSTIKAKSSVIMLVLKQQFNFESQIHSQQKLSYRASRGQQESKRSLGIKQ